MARRLVDVAAVRVYRPGGSEGTRRSSHDGVEYVAVSNRLDRAISRLSHLFRGRRPSNHSLWHSLGYALVVSVGIVVYRPDIVHIQNQFPFARVIRSINRRVPIVLHMHGEWLSDLDRKRVAPALDVVDRVVAASDHVADRIRASWQERSNDCITVPNGVDPEWLQAKPASPADPNILFVGRLSPEKGVHVLIDAFDLIADRHPTATLTIVGPRAVLPRGHLVDVSTDLLVQDLARFYGEERYPDALVEMVPTRLRARVQFRSTMPHRELIDLYGDATIVVNPSLSEAFGMSVVEAMSTGTPVVASAVGGMREILADGVGGLTVPPGDASRLAEALDSLLEDADLRSRLATTGRARVAARYTWDLIALDVSTVYADLENGARSKPLVGRRFDRLVERSEALGLVDLHGRTLVIAPHPDDETLGCGGTIAALTAAGRQVGVVFLTDGALTGGADRATTVEERMAEAQRACEVLGVKPEDTWAFGLPDGGLKGHHDTAVARLGEVLDEFGPTRVFVTHEHDGHPDHEAAFEATRSAIEDGRRDIEVFEYAIWLWSHWPWSPQPMPWPPTRTRVKQVLRGWRQSARSFRRHDQASLRWSVDIHSTAWVKRGALRAYRSQVPSLAEVGQGRFLRWFTTSHELFRRDRL